MNKHEYPNLGETLYEEVLPNGLSVLVAVKPGFRKNAAFFATRYGGADRRFKVNGEWIDTPAGVAHFLEHKMFDMPDGRNVLSDFAALGASPNAFTGTGHTAYYFTGSENFMENLRLLLTYVSTPYYTEESVAKEQGIIGQEICMGEDSPGYAGYFQLLSALYDHHPIRENIAGSVESIAQITPETLYLPQRLLPSLKHGALLRRRRRPRGDRGGGARNTAGHARREAGARLRRARNASARPDAR